MIDLFTFIRSKALDFVTSGSETIMINDVEYSYLENMIEEYKVLNDNEEYQFIFNKMAEDLSNIKNKSKAEIINYLE